MRTSYFARVKKLDLPTDQLVSIARKSPPGFNGRQYKVLAPQWSLLKFYQETHDEARYTELYYEQVLSKLHPAGVLSDLGQDAIMLCWEAAGKFCHRRLVAKWLEDSLGIVIPELVVE